MRIRQILSSSLICLIADLGLAQNLLLKSANIVDPAAQSVTNGHLIIEGATIKQVLKQTPGDFAGETIDLSGKWLIPSLNDMHTHSFGNSGPGRKMQFLSTVGTAKMMLYCGVTGFLDLFNAEDYIIKLRDRQRTKGLIGADIYCAGPCFTCTDGHCTEYGVPTRVINTPEEAKREVSDLLLKKPDVIKLVYDNAHTRMPTVNKETMEALIEIANENNIKTIIHIGNWKDVKDVALAGATAITHTVEEAVPDEIIELLLRKNVYIIPTLTVHTGLLRIKKEPDFLKLPLLNDVVAANILNAYTDTSSFGQTTSRWLKRQKSRQEVVFQNIKKLSDYGVKIMTGTDAGNLGTFQGYSVHTELSLLVEAGLSNWQALAASTTVVGEFWGKKFGVKPEDLANLLILDDSPIKDIRNTEKISMVIHRGKVVDRESLITSQSN